MPIRPIDLSTMFMRLNELSKEQALLQEAVSRQQASQDANAKKKAIEDTTKVQSLEEIHEGPENVKDKDPEPDTENKGSPSDAKKEEAAAQAPQKEVIEVKDPLLGNRIDISG